MTEATRILQALPEASRHTILHMRAVNTEVWHLMWDELYALDVRALPQLRVTQLTATHIVLALPGAHANITNDAVKAL